MQKIFENWRFAKDIYEKINYLESNRRFVLDELVEINDNNHIIPISKNEMSKIMQSAQLKGSPNFLGSGTKGGAYKFSNKVLKFTNDAQEAYACQLILGKDHPNVYNVDFVAQRREEDIENSDLKEKYIITYEFLDYPTRAMLEAAQSLHGRITMGKKPEFFYNFNDETYGRSISLLNNLASIYKEKSSIVGQLPETGLGFSSRKKLEEMCANAGYNSIDIRLVGFFFGGPFSPPKYEDYKTPESFNKYVSENQTNIYRTYLNQLCLGLTFLKNNSIDFHDIKGTNIMQKDDQICIIDIGYSKVREYPTIPTL